jgi:hypothetical protein
MKWLLILLYISTANAYLQKVGNRGRGLIWVPRNITYSLNTSDCGSNYAGDLPKISQDSIDEWANNSWLNLNVVPTNTAPRALVNDIYCGSTGSSAVVGITKVTFNQDTGQIIEADIMLNGDIELSAATETSRYVGNVLTHEIGHSIGFDHSEAFRSSMFYSLFLGQHTISEDDKAGAYSLYPTGPTRGTIEGRVIGGEPGSTIGIFGAFVQAYSTETGELMSSAVSLDDGSFRIKGLPIGDQYFLYVKPLELLSTISKYYSSARVDFCTANSSRDPYRGTFFTDCGTTPGFPQGIELNSNLVNIGSISAYCDLREIKLNRDEDLAVDENRVTPIRDLEVHGYFSEEDIGSTFVSYFTGQELDANESASNTSFQEFEIDLSNTEISNECTLDTFLDIKLTSQNFYSQIQLTMEVIKNYEENPEIFYFSSEYVDENNITRIQTDEDGAPLLNLVGRVPLEKDDPSLNKFKVRITAWNVQFSDYPPYSENDFFPDNGNFEDPIGFYLGIITISESSGDQFKTCMQREYKISDNLRCPGAKNSLKVSAIVDTRSDEKDGGIFSCNSIDPNGGSGSGPLNMVVGFLLVLLVSRVGRDNLKGIKTHGGD